MWAEKPQIALICPVTHSKSHVECPFLLSAHAEVKTAQDSADKASLWSAPRPCWHGALPPPSEVWGCAL